MKNGRALTRLNGKPAVIVNRLVGQSVLFPTDAECAAAGELLARMHASAQSLHAL